MKKELFLQQISDLTELAIIGPMPYSRPIDQEVPIIYVDGGTRHRLSKDHISLSIGDQDSSVIERPLDIVLSKDKDTSDLKSALDIIPDHIKVITFHGFLGGRQDHQMANFGEIHEFLKNRQQKTLCFIDVSFLAHTKGNFTIEHNGTFSLISLIEQEISITGQCLYKLEKKTVIKPLSSHTLSNEGQGEIHIECDFPIFIYLLDD